MSNSDSEARNKFSRRQALLISAAGTGAVLAGTAGALGRSEAADYQEKGDCSTPRSAVAKTQFGKVRGHVEDGVLTFKGVPYGANTGGVNRWLPAKPPAPWDGECPTLTYGADCPQRLRDWSSEQTRIPWPGSAEENMGQILRLDLPH